MGAFYSLESESYSKVVLVAVAVLHKPHTEVEQRGRGRLNGSASIKFCKVLLVISKKCYIKRLKTSH